MTAILPSSNPGLTKEELLAILSSHEELTREAIADAILANNARIAQRLSTYISSVSQ